MKLKALANEDTLLRTHCCQHKCFPVCLHGQHLLQTQIKYCVRNTKMFLILFRNILCPQQMFPSLCSPRNIMSNNVSSFARTLMQGLMECCSFPNWTGVQNYFSLIDNSFCLNKENRACDVFGCLLIHFLRFHFSA